MTGIDERRHNDDRVICLRIFADASGETHMEEFEIALQPRKLFEDNLPLRLSHNFPTSWCNVCHVPSGMGEVDWHNPPQRLLVLWLSGEVEFETSDGDVRIQREALSWQRTRRAKDTSPATLPKANWSFTSRLPKIKLLSEILPALALGRHRLEAVTSAIGTSSRRSAACQLLMLWTAPPRARECHGCGCC